MKGKILILMVLSVCLCLQCGTETDQIDKYGDAGSTCGGDCSDGDPCTLDICVDGQCLNNAVDLDADRDGYVCAECGGDDCDDHDYVVNPGRSEGPYGDATCTDQLDNDCDALTDAQDPDCELAEQPPDPPAAPPFAGRF